MQEFGRVCPNAGEDVYMSMSCSQSIQDGAMLEELTHGRGICEFAQVVLAYLKMLEAVNQVMYAATVAVYGIFRG
jgi:alcohol dehydrogenase YqhD (iron-dependent ADH family)